MNLFSRRLYLLLFSLAFVMLGSGCEQILSEFPFLQSLQPTTAPTATSTPVVTPPPQTTLTAAVPELDPYQITLWLPPEFDPENGTPAGNLLKERLEIFKVEHEEYTLNIRIKAPTGPGGMLDTLSTASLAAPGVVPGILVMHRSEYEKAARAGLLMSIELTELQTGQSDYFPYADEMTLVKGTHYGLPFAGDVLCMAYRPAEVAYPHSTWSELIKVNVKVTAFPASDPRGLMQTLLYMSSGGDFGGDETRVNLDELALQQSLLLLSSGAAVNAFPTWLVDYSTFNQSWEALINSKATYAVLWASQYLADPPDHISINNLPAWEDTNYTLADGWVLAFPQTSAEQYAEFQMLAEHLLDPVFMGPWTESIKLLPVSESALNKWGNTEVSGKLIEVSQSAHILPVNFVLGKIGPLFNQATIELLRKQTTYIESSNKILKALAE